MCYNIVCNAIFIEIIMEVYMKKAILITILCLMSSLVSAGEDTSSKEVSLDYKIAK